MYGTSTNSHNNGFASYTSGDTEEIINRSARTLFNLNVEAGANYIMSWRIAFVLRVKEKETFIPLIIPALLIRTNGKV